MRNLVVASLLVSLAASAHAAVIFSGGGTLSGAQEVPPHAVSGTGIAQVTVDDGNDRDPNTNLFSWDVTFSGLTANLSDAHFHGPARSGVNAGVQVPILTSLLGSPGTSGELRGSANIDASDFRQLANGLWYVNLHTATFPGGEIRAQITSSPVPEPSAMALLGLGLTGLGVPRIRRHRKACK